MKRPLPIILFREEIDMDGELDAARRHLPTTTTRTSIPQGSLVIGRYACLPNPYTELVRDLEVLDAKLINSYQEHQFITRLTDWAGNVSNGITGVLDGLTPRTWTTWANLPEGKSFVIKGRINSKKQSWNLRMYAESRREVPEIAKRLLEDTEIMDQGLVVREYVPLKKLDEGLNGLPVTNEWRTFWLRTENGPRMLAKGYYWQASHPEAGEKAVWDDRAAACALKAAKLVAEHVPFFVLDVAETESGDWIVIEINDGQQSGLCGCSADELYANLADALLPKPREPHDPVHDLIDYLVYDEGPHLHFCRNPLCDFEGCVRLRRAMDASKWEPIE